MRRGEHLQKLPTGTRIIWGLEETQRQIYTLEGLLVQGASPSQCIRIMREKHPGVGSARTQKLTDRIHQQWAREDEEARASNRASAERRIKRMQGIAAGRRDEQGEWIEPPDHAAFARYESLLHDLQGIREPVKINLDIQVSAAVMHLIASMSASDVQEALAEIQELERKATAYTALAESNAAE